MGYVILQFKYNVYQAATLAAFKKPELKALKPQQNVHL